MLMQVLELVYFQVLGLVDPRLWLLLPILPRDDGEFTVPQPW
jgi:hypothetical protein